MTSISFSPDGKQVASASWAKTIIVWDVGSGSVVNELVGHRYFATCVSFSPDGKNIASGSVDSTVIIWDAVLGTIVRKLEAHTGDVTSISFSPDGKQLASASRDMSIIVSDVDSGSVVHRLEGHTSLVTSVSFSPDGKQLASGSTDNTVIIWDAASGSIAQRLKGRTRPLASVSFSLDGKHVISLGSGETATWDLGTEESLDTPERTGTAVALPCDPTSYSATAPFCFEVEVKSRRLYARDALQRRHLVCVLPDLFPLDEGWGGRATASRASCVAWGCKDGRMAIIRVNRVGDVVLA